MAGEPGGARRALTAGLVLTVVAVAFEGMAVPTVMPTVARQLGGLALYGWVFSAFMLTNVIGITAAGRHTDDHGPAGAYLAGLGLFALGLAIGGAAPSMLVLIAARAVQGLGGGALSAVVYACVGRAYPSDQQPRMLALLSSAWVVPGLVGPAVSGFVADHLDWRLVFFGLIPPMPIAAALTLPALRHLSAPKDTATAPSTLGAAAVLAVGIVALLLGLEQPTTASGVAAIVGGAALMLPALRRLMPDGTLTARPGQPAAIVEMGLVCMAFFGAETVVPLLLTTARGQTSVAAGLALTGASLSWTTGAWVQARLAGTGSRRSLVAVAAGLIALGIAAVSTVARQATPVGAAWAAWAVTGLGMGIGHATISLIVLEQAPAGSEGTASAAMQLAGVIGIALGAGIAGVSILVGSTPAVGFVLAFGLMTLTALAAVAIAPRLPDRR